MTGEPALPLVERARSSADRPALAAAAGTYTYQHLLDASERVAAGLLEGAGDLAEARVAFLVPPSFAYVAVQWGIWRAGGVAVPVAVSHPPPELEYVVEDTGAAAIVASPELAERVRGVAERRGLRLRTAPELLGGGSAGSSPGSAGSPPNEIFASERGDAIAGSAEREHGRPRVAYLPAVAPSRRAMILYTSGTTSRPKGVVTTHANLEAQVRTLVDAWGWRADDHILLVLPLHHVHGIVNVLACALWSGARCSVHARFDAEETWDAIARGDLTLFMAVPTVYSKLIAAWESSSPERREALSAGCRRLRLMVSGSAALPVSLLETWREISGHLLLERYGMTEIGMALSNPLEGERRPGYVGVPLPGVDARLVDEEGREVEPGTPGEIEVRGPSVFHEYWQRPEATRDAFRDGWFRTGDVAVVEDGYWRILGRQSVDIIKTGGFKVSALEIEEVLREHPSIRECAVVGVADPEWGERVGAALVLESAAALSLAELRSWAAERLAPYKVPTRLRVLPELPRNVMGKVTKPAVASLFQPHPASAGRNLPPSAGA